MRNFYLLLLLLPLLSKSQTASSIANGSWLNPTTWNCACVPVNGYSVTVNHSVTLNTSMAFTTGGIVVNNSGSLVQDANRDILISGGYFYNYGLASFRFYAQSAGTGSNIGTFSLTAFTNSTSFVNSGTINLDSIYIAASFTNSATGKINGNRATNASSMINNGRFTFSLSLNTGTLNNNNYHSGYAFTNSNVYNNFDSLVMSYSMWNKVKFNNTTSGLVRLSKNFHNTVPGGTATFDNQGKVEVLDSWYNTDTVKGTVTGTFTVADTSANSGFMKGNFQFCDQTPPGAAPYVDLNSGTIQNGITWCSLNALREDDLNNKPLIFPNPARELLKIRFTGSDQKSISIELISAAGISVYSSVAEPKAETQIDLKNLQQGIYIMKISEGEKIHLQKILIE